MFFRKSSHTDESVTNKWLKKIDKVVTGLILGGIIASIYGIKKRSDKQEDYTHLDIDTDKEHHKKQSIFSRIFFGDK